MRWSILESLNEGEQRDLLSSVRRRRFERREVIFHEGDPGDSLFLIDRGHVGIEIHTPLGDVATVRVLRPGEFFGELAVVSPGPRNATARALDRVDTLSLRSEQLEELRGQHSNIERVLTVALVTEVRRLAVLLVEAMYLPVEKRVWRRVAELATSFEVEAGEVPHIPLTQDVLSQLAGCTRPTLNQILRVGEANGIVKIERGRLEILDEDGLRRAGR